ncbi:MAG: hypothetical protein JW787_15525 [Sedimentisphaerales bacterium]|nr:hypothetical protein [Sedimentisphaerales bacterium]
MKSKNFLIIFVLCFFLLIIVTQIVPFVFHIPQKPPLLAIAKAGLREMSPYLVQYYNDNSILEKEIKNYEIVNFLEKECGALSKHVFLQEPALTLGSPLNIGIFLCLPKKLESECPTIIAYTEPIKEYNRMYRVALFLYKAKMSAIEIDSTSIEELFGIKNTDTLSIPDFYYCWAAGEKSKNSTPP